MSKRKSIIRQTQERLESLAAYGQSKRQARAENGGKSPYIHSFSTMQSYLDASCHFVKWARSAYRCRDLDAAREHVPEYLTRRIQDGLSAWTVAKDAAALSKLYGTSSDSWGVDLPRRRRADVTQHRHPEQLTGFSWERHRDLLDLACSCGLRRHELLQLRPEDVTQRDGQTFVHVRQGKGGKSRTVLALNDTPARMAADAAGRSRIVDHIPKRAPIHSCRREYARTLYERLARPLDSLSEGEKYRCRGDRAGDVFDRQAMATVSGNLGHARLDVITAYI